MLEENKVIIDLGQQDIKSLVQESRYIPHEVDNRRSLYSIATGVVLLIVFTLISIAQMLEWKPLDNFIAFQDIQRNFNNWNKVISNYEELQSHEIQALVAGLSNYSNFVCIDYGSYYLPAHFKSSSIDNTLRILPSAVRRGNGDAWAVTKSAGIDTAAYQQCLYVASELSDREITCGSDMYNKLGYGGFLNQGHWCNNAKDLLYQYYTAN